jgi:hypothetical protein
MVATHSQDDMRGRSTFPSPIGEDETARIVDSEDAIGPTA